MSPRRGFAVPLAAIGLLCMLVIDADAAARSRLVIVLVPGMTAADIRSPEVPSLHALCREAQVGWMNARTARVPGKPMPEVSAAYATLGAGTRAAGSDAAEGPGLDAHAVLARDNAGLDHVVPLGALGDALARAGVRVAVAGAEDRETARRAARWVVADARGIADDDHMEPDAWARRDSAAPYGIRTDVRALTEGSDADVVVWVYADLDRADRYAANCLPTHARRHRLEALRGLDEVVRAARLRGEAILLLAPCPAASTGPPDRLASVLLLRPGAAPGALRSPSTRRAGLIANTDILPTVLSALGLSGGRAAVGRAASAEPYGPAMDADAWAAMHGRWLGDARRQALFGGLPTVQALLVVAGAALLRLARGSRSGSSTPAVAGCAAAVAILPIAHLLLPLVVDSMLAAVGAMSVTLCGAGIAGAVAPRRASRWLLPTAGALITVVVADLCTGAHLIQRAWMSYSVMEGARYYGIGNEYAAALLPAGLAVCLFAALPVAAGAWLGILVVVAHPSLGANAGGAVGLAAGFIAAAAVLRTGRLTARHLAWAGAAGAIALAVGLAADSLGPAGGQSHIARAIAGGPVAIAARKLDLNVYLLTHSPWALTLAAGAAAVVACDRGPLQSQRRTDGAFLAGLTVGAVALLIANDSGVVACAQALTLGWALLACRYLGRPEDPATT